MADVEVFSGVCGFNTVIQAETGGKYKATIHIESACPHVTKLAEKINGLGEVNAMNELFKKGQSQILASCTEILPHVTCPVSVGILKALEACTGMALPKDATITFRK